MTDVISLSDLSDEPIEQPAGLGYAFSERLEAVWDRLPPTKQGQKARLRQWLARAGIDSVAKLIALDKYGATGIGPASLATIDSALAVFGLHRVGVDPPVVVRDGASADEAHCQRLRKWIEERMATLTAGPDDDLQFVADATERSVLVDVMLILDGREPKNERRW